MKKFIRLDDRNYSFLFALFFTVAIVVILLLTFDIVDAYLKTILIFLGVIFFSVMVLVASQGVTFDYSKKIIRAFTSIGSECKKIHIEDIREIEFEEIELERKKRYFPRISRHSLLCGVNTAPEKVYRQGKVF